MPDRTTGQRVQFVLMPYPTPSRYLRDEELQKYRGLDEKNRNLMAAYSSTLQQLQADAPGVCDRPLVAVEPDGDPFVPGDLPARSLLAFGGERHGLSDELSARAELRIGIPMRAGVSSLNLATSVAAVLFAWRLSRSPAPVS